MIYYINYGIHNCTGDVIRFFEGVFGGSFRKPKCLGNRQVIAKVTKDSYGAVKQQHTFTLQVIESTGYTPLTNGSKTRRKGLNVYKNGTERQYFEVTSNETHSKTFYEWPQPGSAIACQLSIRLR